MNKTFLRRLLEDELVARDIDPDDAAEIVDSVLERCDEEGVFDTSDDYSESDFYDEY